MPICKFFKACYLTILSNVVIILHWRYINEYCQLTDWLNDAWHGMAWRGVVWCGVVWCGHQFVTWSLSPTKKLWTQYWRTDRIMCQRKSMVKSIWTRQLRHAACMEKITNVPIYNTLNRISQDHLKGRGKQTWEDNIKMDLHHIGF
jgi:hypothetical protein